MNKEELKQYIDQNVYENQDGDITGEALNAVLKAIVDDGGTQVEANPTGEPTETLEKLKIGETIYGIPQTNLPKGLLYGGEVYPDTVITPDIHCYYIANGSGNYISFGNALVGPAERICYLYYDESNEQWDYSEFDTYKYSYANSKFEQLTDLSTSTIQVSSAQEFTNAERLQALANVSNQEAEYDDSTPPVFTGKMGYVVLQPQDDDDLEHTSFAAQIANKPNTIFEIRDVFDLDDDVVEIPANCTLKFNGGVIKNGSIDFNGCYIDGDKPQLLNIEPSGMVANEKIQPQVFGAKGDGVTDDTKAIHNALLVCNYVDIPDGDYQITKYYAEGGLCDSITQEGGTAKNAIYITRSNVTLHMAPNAILRAASINDDAYASQHNRFTAVIYVLGHRIVENNIIVGYENIKNIRIEGGNIISDRSMFSSADYDTSSGGKSRENYASVVCAYVDGLIVKDVVVTDNSGDAFYCAPVWNAQFENVETARNRRCSIGIGVCDNVVINNCYFHDEKQEYTYPNGNTNTGLTSNAPIVIEPEPASIMESGLVTEHAVKNLTISNCKYDAGDWSVFFKGGCEFLRIYNNNFYNINSIGGVITLTRTGNASYYDKWTISNVQIENNIFDFNEQETYTNLNSYAITASTNDGISIVGNRFNNRGGIAFYTTKGKVRVSNNTCNYCKFILINTAGINSDVSYDISNNIVDVDCLINNNIVGIDSVVNMPLSVHDNIVRPWGYPNTSENTFFSSFPVSVVNIYNNDIVSGRLQVIKPATLGGETNIKNNRIKFTYSSAASFYPFGQGGNVRNVFKGSIVGNTFDFAAFQYMYSIPDGFNDLFIFKDNVFVDNKVGELIDGKSEYVVNTGNIYFKNKFPISIGSTSERPQSVKDCFSFYDTTLKKMLYANNGIWLDENGIVVRDGTGTTSERPTISTVDFSGFQFYDISTSKLYKSVYSAGNPDADPVVPPTLSWTEVNVSYKVYDDSNIGLVNGIPSTNLLQPNTFYNIGYLDEDVSIGLASQTDQAILNVYKFMFLVVSEVPTITWLGDWDWFDGTPPTIKQNKLYYIEVVNGVAIVKTKDLDSSVGGELCFTACKNNSTIKIQKIQNNNAAPAISLEYSMNGTDWSDYNFDANGIGDTITLPTIGKRVFMRSKNDTYQSLGATYNDRWHQFVMTGKIAASGDLTSLLKKSGNVLELQSYAFMSLFMDCSQLLSAPNIPSTSIKSNNVGVLRNSFRGCTNLKKAPTINIGVLGNDALYGMFNNATSLNYIRILSTDISAQSCTNSWVTNVNTTGSFYCDQNLVITTGVNGIPNNWTRYNLDGTPWVDPNAE